ncbi:hypothetical protein N0V91_001658 [Didymella pomorum]|uniref:Uncharacterized protein n=1 Tax=Didymella pomorum TaxID=749634 RepID=A0A9W9DA30_9PLEO|nr:hypothetical protein N0V91_001658 [Didymella pomorum]
MRDSATPAPAAQRSTVAFDGFKEPAGGRRWATFDFPAIRPQPASQNLEHYAESSSGWSAKHDFEQRVGRNGIKISEAIDNTATNTTVLPVVQKRSGARSTLDGEDYSPLKTATMASFTNAKKGTKVEALER